MISVKPDPMDFGDDMYRTQTLRERADERDAEQNAPTPTPAPTDARGIEAAVGCAIAALATVKSALLSRRDAMAVAEISEEISDRLFKAIQARTVDDGVSVREVVLRVLLHNHVAMVQAMEELHGAGAETDR
jgi:hypothetical protein